MNSINFSIITPVFNREKVIGRCINSVLEQSYKDYELIVIDDGSSDKSVNILETYGQKINLLINKNNQGVNYSRNRCILQAKGKYVLFLDSDDYLTPGALESIVKLIKTESSFNHYLFSIDYRSGEKGLPVTKGVFTYKDWILGKVSGDFVHVVKRHVFDHYLFFEQFRGAEHLNWLRVYRDYGDQMFFNNSVLIVDRTSANSISQSGALVNVGVMSEQLSVRLKYLELYGNDLVLFDKNEYERNLTKSILLSICIRDFVESKRLIELLPNKILRFILNRIDNLFFSTAIRYLVITKGRLKTLLGKNILF